MPDQFNLFRDFGILPDDVSPPSSNVRAYFSTGHVIGQYIGTALAVVIGLGLSVLALLMPFPSNIIAPIAVITLVGAGVYIIGRHDYAWVELQGDVIRAKHLYTRRIIERRVHDIEELVTIVIPFVTAATVITEIWLGRIKGIKIVFRDGKSPLPIMRSDPAMTNAQELIEAVMFRMSEVGLLDAEIADLDGKPLVRRVFWKTRPSSSD